MLNVDEIARRLKFEPALIPFMEISTGVDAECYVCKTWWMNPVKVILRDTKAVTERRDMIWYLCPDSDVCDYKRAVWDPLSCP